MTKQCRICDHYHARTICPVCGAMKLGNKYYDGHKDYPLELVRVIPRKNTRLPVFYQGSIPRPILVKHARNVQAESHN